MLAKYHQVGSVLDPWLISSLGLEGLQGLRSTGAVGSMADGSSFQTIGGRGVPMATLAVGEFKWIYDNLHFWRPIFFLYSQASLILLLLTRSGIGKATPSITIDFAGHWFYTPKHGDRENMRTYLQKLSAKSWPATVKAATSCRSEGFLLICGAASPRSWVPSWSNQHFPKPRRYR